MISKEEWRWVAIWATALVALASLPYLVAYLATPDDSFFTGFLPNPTDNHTYLAKVRQGMWGSWTLRMAFTAERHEGEFLFTIYPLLGHIARWTGLQPVVVMHIARVANGYLLLLALYYALAWLFDDLPRRRFAFTMASLGSGLGWLALLAGHTAVDMKVPEGYVFYSLYVNVHFPLAIALMLLTLVWSVTPWEGGRVQWLRFAGVALCAATLGVVQTFCLATVGLTLLAYTVWRWAQQRRVPWHQVASGLAIGAAGLPLAVNAYLAVQRNPVYAAWSAQNQTPSPPPWEYALGYGVVLVLAAWGGYEALRRRHGRDLFLLSWAVSTIALLYVPFSLQRRFVMGLIIPLGGLGAIGWYALPGRWRPRAGIAWGMASLSHLLLIGMSIVVGLTQHQAPCYMERNEYAAMRWLADHVPQDALVAAAPQTGLFIPSWAGQRVFYGHPYETAEAERREAEVRTFFAEHDLTVLPYRPDYVFYGERERALRVADWSPEERWQAVYRNETVAVYAVPKE
jgi:hypothetical protein